MNSALTELRGRLPGGHAGASKMSEVLQGATGSMQDVILKRYVSSIIPVQPFVASN